MRTSFLVVTGGIFALLGTTPEPVAPAALFPLVAGWEREFTIESQTTPKDGRSLVTGTVLNTSTCGAKRIQLLIDALDRNGQVVDQKVVWLGSDLTPGSHVYFEVPVASAASHRVSVFAFDPKKRC